MPDRDPDQPAHPATLESLAFILRETRADIAEIKTVLGPLTEWKWRMQGAVTAISFILTAVIGSGGFLAWRWWDQSVQTALVQSDIKHIQNDLTVASNQVALARSSSESSGQSLTTLDNKTKDYDATIADLKSRISALETGAITKHIK